MAYSLVAHTLAQSTNTNTIVSSGINTTGADTLFVAVSWYVGGGGGAVLSDSKGNTWTALTLRSSGGDSGRSQLYYCKSATVGSGHTFTVTGTGSYPALAVAAFSGGDLSAPFDVENGATNFTTGVQPGSITPSVNDEIVITEVGNVTAIGAFNNINGGFTTTDVADRITNGVGVNLAYLIQTTAAAANPTWTHVQNAIWRTLAIASFKSASGGGGTTITGALGTAVASGFKGNVNASRILAGSLGTATASGFKGNVNANRTIAGTLGVAVASGFKGNVNANRTIAGALGVAVASGFQGTVVNDSGTTIAGNLGVAVASGFKGGINANRTIAGILGVAVASGFTGVVSNGGTTGGGSYDGKKQKRKVLKDIRRLNELILKDDLPKFDVAQITPQAIAQVYDENDDEEALMLLFA